MAAVRFQSASQLAALRFSPSKISHSTQNGQNASPARFAILSLVSVSILGRVKFSFDRSWFPPKIMRSTDEWCNYCLCVQVPFIGDLDIFYGRHVDRASWWLSGGRMNPDNTWEMHWVSPDYELYATAHEDRDIMDDSCPHTRTSEWIFANAYKIESLDLEEDDEVES